MRRLLFVVLMLAACNGKPSRGNTSLTIDNQAADTIVYVSFGADSKITAASWSFCSGNGLTCNFPLTSLASKPLPNPKGSYLNATFSFGAPVACGVTKAEVNINNPTWYDTLDVSLVDGYSNKIEIVATPTKGQATILGPPHGATGNEKVFGVFPLGCDICTARQNPPCGIKKGSTGCKAGTQYDPKPPCQWQGPKKGGGGLAVTVAVMP